MFSIRVKELFEPMNLRKKRPVLFLLFEPWVTVGDFTVKNNFWKRNLYLTEIDFIHKSITEKNRPTASNLTTFMAGICQELF